MYWKDWAKVRSMGPYLLMARPYATSPPLLQLHFSLPLLCWALLFHPSSALAQEATDFTDADQLVTPPLIGQMAILVGLALLPYLVLLLSSVW